MNKFNQIAFGFAIGFLACFLIVHQDVPIAESAPAVDLVPAQEAKAEPAAGVSIEGPSDSGVESPPLVIPPESVSKPSLKDAIAAYKAGYGVKYFVYGTDDRTHLIRDHGWHADQLAGLSLDELQYLHGASHTGQINPADYSGGDAGVAAHTPTTPALPKITIHTAPFRCSPCNQIKGYDWSGFDVTWEVGGAINGFPEISWLDGRGVKRLLNGPKTPKQVRWSMDRTQ